MSQPTTTPPYGAYAGITATLVAGLAAAGAAARLLGRDPREQSTLDLAVLAAATFKAARTISRDDVTSFLREPFVEGHAKEGAEDPVETGDARQAIGELVTCSRCIGTYSNGVYGQSNWEEDDYNADCSLHGVTSPYETPVWAYYLTYVAYDAGGIAGGARIFAAGGNIFGVDCGVV